MVGERRQQNMQIYIRHQIVGLKIAHSAEMKKEFI